MFGRTLRAVEVDAPLHQQVGLVRDVLVGEAAGRVRLALGHGVDQRAPDSHRLFVLGVAQQRPDQVAELGPEIGLVLGDPRRLGRSGEFDAEFAIRPPALPRRAGRAQSVHPPAQRRDLDLRSALRGQLGSGAHDRLPLIAELAQLADRQPGQAGPAQRVAGGPGDEAAAAASAPGLDQAAVPQVRERLAQRQRRDAQLLGQRGLRRQPLARRDQPAPDRLGEVLGHLIGPAGPVPPPVSQGPDSAHGRRGQAGSGRGGGHRGLVSFRRRSLDANTFKDT